MKSMLLLAFYAILSANMPTTQPNAVVGQHQLSLEEAERILGESAILKVRANETQNGVYVTKSTFTAKEVDATTKQQGTLYYMFEQYKKEEEATKTIQSFMESNKNHQGFELLTNYGDEAFFHSDKRNFCLIVIRKGSKILRIKVNNVTSKTAFEEVRKIGKTLIERV